MNLIFNFFLIFTLISAIFFFSSRNPIHSIMFFILIICNVSGILFFLHIEFLALIFLVVYVGAISILFLFIVMMLNIRVLELGNKLFNYFTINSFIWIIFFLQISFMLLNYTKIGDSFTFLINIENSWISILNSIPNIKAIGQLLYLYYFDYFIIAGFILLVAMIASIILTLEYKIEIRNPNIYEQILTKTSLKLKY